MYYPILILFFLALLPLPAQGEPPRVGELPCQEESSTTLQVTLEQEFAISLPGNPSTGFSWAIEAMPEWLCQVGEAQYTPANSALGAGGIYHWRFKALGAGQGLLSLVYQRPWEEDIAPAKCAQYHIQVLHEN
jgi:inhibitor of cysteine peptidase